MLTLLLSLSVVNGYVLRSIRLPRAASPAMMAESPTFFAKLFNKDEAPAVAEKEMVGVVQPPAGALAPRQHGAMHTPQTEHAFTTLDAIPSAAARLASFT